VGIITILCSAEPERIKTPALLNNSKQIKKFMAFWRRHGLRPPRVLVWFYHSILAPILDFKRHKKWLWILVYISIFKLADSFVKIMDSQFYLDLGFTKQQIANATKIFGMGATIIGGVIGSFLVNGIGIARALLWSSVLHACSNLVFLIQAAMGNDILTLYLTIAVEDLTGGMATMAFVVYLASLYTPAYRTLQNAFFWSIIGFFRSLFSAAGGWTAEQMSWPKYYLMTFFLAFPAILLLRYINGKSHATAHERHLKP
jgi:PAT family beta-lactamase induction signal transducer AmpG